MKCSICEFESENVCDFRIFHEIETLNPMLIMLKFLCKKCGQTMLVGPVKEKIPLGSRRVAPDGTPEIYVKKVAAKESGWAGKTCDNCAENSEGRCPGHPARVCGSWQAKAKVAEKQSDNKEKINAIKRLIISPMEGVDTAKIKARAKELGVSDEEIAAWEEQSPRPIDGYQENYEIKAWEKPLPPGYKVLSRETLVKEEFVVYVGEPDPKGLGVSMSEHLQYMLSGDIRIKKTDYIESGRYYAVYGTRTYKAGE